MKAGSVANGTDPGCVSAVAATGAALAVPRANGNGGSAVSGPSAGGTASRSDGNGAGASSSRDSGSAQLHALLESLLFVADGPVALSDLARALDVERKAVELALHELGEASVSRGLRLQRTNGSVQMVTAPEAAPAIQRFLGLEQVQRLSRAALEVLAMVAYRQPVTRPEIDALRGVDSDGTLRTLLGRALIEPVGRRPTVGHPVEYGTTFQFLEYFGLTSLGELPAVESFAALAEGDALHA